MRLSPWSVAPPPESEDVSYDDVASDVSRLLISRYSTSFSLASMLLDSRDHGHIARVYGLVRLADEVVDGPVARRDPQVAAAVLRELREETFRAWDRGHSANLVVHAFMLTAGECGLDRREVEAFFDSMDMDLDPVDFDERAYRSYIYGSAEVVGLMCLRVFLAGAARRGEEAEQFASLAPGAQALGAAFQKINFLRDYATDLQLRGRSYFPGLGADGLDEEAKRSIVADISRDLAAARAAIPRLPRSAGRAVGAACALFGELMDELERTPAHTISQRRIRIGNLRKARVVGGSLVRGALKNSRKPQERDTDGPAA